MNGNANGFSFKGKLPNGRACYLRHVDTRVWCSANDGSKEFNGQATYFVTDPLTIGSKGYTFESADTPEYVLSHDKNMQVKLVD